MNVHTIFNIFLLIVLFFMHTLSSCHVTWYSRMHWMHLSRHQSLISLIKWMYTGTFLLKQETYITYMYLWDVDMLTVTREQGPPLTCLTTDWALAEGKMAVNCFFLWLSPPICFQGPRWLLTDCTSQAAFKGNWEQKKGRTSICQSQDCYNKIM